MIFPSILVMIIFMMMIKIMIMIIDKVLSYRSSHYNFRNHAMSFELNLFKEL